MHFVVMSTNMNDFTKEELTILFLELNIAIRHWGEAEEYKDYPILKDKIQSMIDNYCEHEANNLLTSKKVAEELVKLIMNPVNELIEEIITKRSQLVIEHALKYLRPK